MKYYLENRGEGGEYLATPSEALNLYEELFVVDSESNDSLLFSQHQSSREGKGGILYRLLHAWVDWLGKEQEEASREREVIALLGVSLPVPLLFEGQEPQRGPIRAPT